MATSFLHSYLPYKFVLLVSLLMVIYSSPQITPQNHNIIRIETSTYANENRDLTRSNQQGASSTFQQSSENTINLDNYIQRKLQQNAQTNSSFITVATLIFQFLFPICRNLILVGIVTNSIDIFLPYLILSESFLMLGFWACQKHYLYNLFSNVFSSYWDILNAIRLLIMPNNQPPNLLQLSQYGFSSIAFINVSGQFFVGFLLLTFTILSKMTILCTKYECLRRMATNLRPIWNGYFFAVFPRVATLTGLHWRALGAGSKLDTLNAITCTLLSILIIIYFVIILIQTKRINLQKNQTCQNKQKLGLLSRIDHKKQFKFDFLQFSCIYYPCMNYLRLFIYFMPIGLIWDCKQLSYGGPFFSQFLMIMIQISSTGYKSLRNKIMFPLFNFLLMLVQICIVIIGLAQSIPYSQISQTYQILLYTLLYVIFTTSLVITSLDFLPQIGRRCNNKVTQSIEQKHKKENDTTQTFGNQHHTRKCEGSDDEADHEQVKSHRHQKQQSKKQNSLTKLKIKKARKQTPNKCNFIFQ